MRRITNQKQFEVLFAYLKENPFLVLDNTKTTEAFSKRKELWTTLMHKLNYHGPPKRNWFEWKRVWIGYKKKLKWKLRSRSATTNRGKRPTFTEIDEWVIDFLELRETVQSDGERLQLLLMNDGSDNSSDTEATQKLEKVAGSASKAAIDYIKESLVNRTNDSAESISQSDRAAANVQDEIVRYALDATKSLVESVRCPSLSPVNSEGSTNEKQLQILGLLRMLNQQMSETNELEEKILQLEHTKIESMKANNFEKNKRAYIEIELKRKELEIYELKVNRLCNHCTVNNCCVQLTQEKVNLNRSD